MYKLTRFDSITRLADGASIPRDPANRDYAEFLKWEAEGGVAVPADPLPPVVVKPTLEDVVDALKAKGVIVDADLDAILVSKGKK